MSVLPAGRFQPGLRFAAGIFAAGCLLTGCSSANTANNRRIQQLEATVEQLRQVTPAAPAITPDLGTSYSVRISSQDDVPFTATLQATRDDGSTAVIHLDDSTRANRPAAYAFTVAAITVTASKTQPQPGVALHVEILRNGRLMQQGDTSAPRGTVSLSAPE